MDRIPAFLQEDENVYFAAANTVDGFRSYFSKIFDPAKLDRLVILKGGPGTGKSTLLIRLALLARERGYRRECFLCSSDTSSLDAVFLPELKLAAVDGTSPHLVEPVCPGAVETLFDAGAFWNVEQLKKDRKLFFELLTQKREAYRRAYRMLHTAGAFQVEEREANLSALDREKLQNAAKRLFSQTVTRFSGFSLEYRQTSAFSRNGFLYLKSLLRQAATRVAVSSSGGAGACFLSEILALARERKAKVIVSTSILSPNEFEAIYFPCDKVLFYLDTFPCDEPQRRVNMERFLLKEVQKESRNKRKLYHKLCASVLNEAAGEFARAGALHAALESKYIASMDFHGLSEAWEEELSKLF